MGIHVPACCVWYICISVCCILIYEYVCQFIDYVHMTLN